MVKKSEPNRSNSGSRKRNSTLHSHRAKKRFGQNFLNDKVIIDQIISAIRPKSEDQIIEIGPGMGALTAPLLLEVDHLHVIEIDKDLVQMIRQRYNDVIDKITIHQADALTVDYSQLTAKQTPLRIVGNLPYNISTPILFHLMEHKSVIEDMHFMLQKEVVDRMVAEPGNKQYGRLSVMLQYHCQIESLFDVPPTAFTPQPKVMSSIVCLKPRAQPITLATDLVLFNQLVASAFNQRRKVIRNSLGKIATVEQIESAGIDSNMRPEQVNIESFVTLCNLLTQSNTRDC